jgi:ABC-type transport system involved in multi-copper enzyme maturation permease subunit
MKTLLLKEARMLLPFWIAALALAAVPVWMASPGWPFAGMTPFWFGVGVVLLSVVPFGMEFSHGTFQMMLAQPVPRRQIWLAKVFIALVAMVSALGLFAICWQWRAPGLPVAHGAFSDLVLTGSMTILAALAGGLWTTLLFRQIAAAIWFTPLVPGFLFVMVTGLTDGFSREGSLVPGVLSIVAYALLSLAWAGWLFARAQDVPWTGGSITLKLPFASGSKREAARVETATSPWPALIRKELHLLQAGLLIVVVMAVLQLALILVRKLLGASVSLRVAEWMEIASMLMWFLWLCVPMVFGAMSVAEERKLGTEATQLCLPVSRRGQFAVKLACVLTLSVLCAAAVPWLMQTTAFGISTDVLPTSREGGWEIQWTALTAILIGLASFYASTLARTTLQALSIALMIIVTVAVAGAATLYGVTQGLDISLRSGFLLGCIAWPVMLGTIVWLAFTNYRRLDRGMRVWVRNGVMLLSAWLGAASAAAFIHQRTWELVMTMEPEHGPAVIARDRPARLCEAFPEKWFVLLPDGRLWTSPDRLLAEWTDYEHWQGQPSWSRSRHGFFPGTNWVDVASAGREVFAIRADGSLWRVFQFPTGGPPQIEQTRIGNDSDWSRISADAGFALAIKRDGTLWGWGDNRRHQLTSDHPETNAAPVRIGTDADWVACFAVGWSSVGVKRDGSVWKWGRPAFGPDGQAWTIEVKQPIRWKLTGEGLRTFIVRHDRDEALYEDGHIEVLSFTDPEPHRLSPPDHRDAPDGWAAMTSGYDGITVLGRDGTLWKLPYVPRKGTIGWAWDVDPKRAERINPHSDWVGMHGHYQFLLAVAADGTLHAWWKQPDEVGRLLRRTRRPIGSLNLFASDTMAFDP